MTKKELVCIYGVGGVGGYFGGIIANRINQNSDNTKEVYFIARGAHLDEIKRKGLILKINRQNEIICKPFWTGENYKEMPTPDIILLCVKSYDLEPALNEIKTSIRHNTIVVPLLNGVDIYERMRKVLNAGVILPACVYVAAHIEAPGLIMLDDNKGGLIILGKDPANPDFIPENVLNLFNSVGLRYKWYDNPFSAIWEKYLFIASFALVTALYDKNFKEVIADVKARQHVINIMYEIINIAKCEGVDLDTNLVEKYLARAESLQNQAKSSYQRDIEKGRLKNEGDIFGETIIRLGKKYGVNTLATEKAVVELANKLNNRLCDV